MEIRFGHWTTTQERGTRRLCRCDCGTTRYVAAQDLKAGKSTNCGCVGMRSFIGAAKRANTKHGMWKSAEFRIWTDMKRRCHDPRRPDYHRYGGRGISVCHEWRESFENFYRDMGPRPEGHTLDRMNNAGNYNKQNCTWAPKKVQDRNKRTNRIVEVDGARMTLADAAERYGIGYNTLINRANTLGWPIDLALKAPVIPRTKPRSRLVSGQFASSRAVDGSGRWE